MHRVDFEIVGGPYDGAANLAFNSRDGGVPERIHVGRCFSSRECSRLRPDHPHAWYWVDGEDRPNDVVAYVLVDRRGSENWVERGAGVGDVAVYSMHGLDVSPRDEARELVGAGTGSTPDVFATLDRHRRFVGAMNEYVGARLRP